MQAELVEIKKTLYRMLHVSVPKQEPWLGQVVCGYLAYHAVPTNSQAMTPFVHYVTWHWKQALGRRNQKGNVTWARMAPIVAHWLPLARVRRLYPQERFIVKHPRWEPIALAAHARICSGGAGLPRVPSGMTAINPPASRREASTGTTGVRAVHHQRPASACHPRRRSHLRRAWNGAAAPIHALISVRTSESLRCMQPLSCSSSD